jgi:hypothetical protein
MTIRPTMLRQLAFQLAMISSDPDISLPSLDAEERKAQVVTHAEVCECTCPEFCERDHEFD